MTESFMDVFGFCILPWLIVANKKAVCKNVSAVTFQIATVLLLLVGAVVVFAFELMTVDLGV